MMPVTAMQLPSLEPWLEDWLGAGQLAEAGVGVWGGGQQREEDNAYTDWSSGITRRCLLIYLFVSLS